MPNPWAPATGRGYKAHPPKDEVVNIQSVNAYSKWDLISPSGAG